MSQVSIAGDPTARRVEAPRHLGIALLVIAFAQLMVVLDTTIVNVALPSIQQALHFNSTDLEWVINGYSLAFGGLLLLGGRAGDLFGRLVATGVVCWFAFQAFENIGMTVGIMPVTGLPLPFVSYGGSAMFAVMLATGLLQNVHMRSRS